jgi:hypothetical protein
MPMICCSESSTEFFEIINYIQAFMKIAPPGESWRTYPLSFKAWKSFPISVQKEILIKKDFPALFKSALDYVT